MEELEALVLMLGETRLVGALVIARVGSQSCLMCFHEIEIFSRMTLVR